MIAEKIIRLLADREFVHVATSDLNNCPNVAPKFFLKAENDFIYLVDHVISLTWENLKANPRVAISVLDMDTLTGYQIKGSVQIIDKGTEYNKILNEQQEKEISLTIERIIEGIHQKKRHRDFEVAFPEKVAIFKVKIEEVMEIGSRGKLTREKL